MNPEPDRSEADAADDAKAVPEEEDAAETADAEAAENDPIAELQARADENWDKYLRAAAELDNVRKRAARDVEKAHKFALERFAADLLTVCDSLEMALAADDASVASLQAGSEATMKQLTTVLQRIWRRGS